MVDKEFIAKAFDVIKQEFDIFKELDIALNITEFNKVSKEDSVFNVSYTINNKDKIFNIVITVIHDLDELRSKRLKKFKDIVDSNSEFLGPLGIEQTDEVFMLLCLLHEFAHVDYVSKFINNTKPINYLYHQNNAISSLKLVFGIKFFSEFVYRNFIPDELYADMFKYKHFYKIYKLLY